MSTITVFPVNIIVSCRLWEWIPLKIMGTLFMSPNCNLMNQGCTAGVHGWSMFCDEMGPLRVIPAMDLRSWATYMMQKMD